MSKKIKTVGLFGKYGDKTVGQHISTLSEFLHQRRLTVIIEAATAKLITDPKEECLPLDDVGKQVDLAVVIGGDGTFLNVARALARYQRPLVGVNLGRLGFLTDIPIDKMTKEVGKILDGDFESEERFMLDAEIMRQGKIIHKANALNDVIINKSELARLIEFESYLDGEFVNSMRADGIIVATPTGCTAYALSAGGPILHPTLAAMVLVPICPHTLSDRPIVVKSDSVVEMILTGDTDQTAQVTFDGQTNFPIRYGDRVYIRRSPVTLVMWHPTTRNHYEVLRVKLHWGAKL